jgi:hypothetical protein
VRWVTKAEEYLNARHREGCRAIQGAGQQADGDQAMSRRKGEIIPADLKRKWPRQVALAAEKVRDP